MTEENDNNNLADYTAYKLRQLVEEHARHGRLEYANAIQDALDSYLLGTVRIAFKDGKPYVADINKDDSA